VKAQRFNIWNIEDIHLDPGSGALRFLSGMTITSDSLLIWDDTTNKDVIPEVKAQRFNIWNPGFI